jgi:hypothetical protein
MNRPNWTMVNLSTMIKSKRDSEDTGRQRLQEAAQAASNSPHQTLALSWTPPSHNETIQSNEGVQLPRRSNPKRRRSDDDTEAQADQAATVIVDKGEQETTGPTPHKRATQHTLELPKLLTQM